MRFSTTLKVSGQDVGFSAQDLMQRGFVNEAEGYKPSYFFAWNAQTTMQSQQTGIPKARVCSRVCCSTHTEDEGNLGLRRDNISLM